MSGTGNTASAAAVIGAEMARAGWSVASTELTAAWGPGMTTLLPNDLLVVCFPVLGFGVPALVRRAVRRLRGNGRPAAVFATWGGEGQAALWQARRLLGRRGFRLVHCGGSAYPFQWTQVIPPPRPEDARLVVDEGNHGAREFARELIAGLRSGAPRLDARAPRLSVSAAISLPIAWLYASIGRFGLGALYAADERCTGCGVCCKLCPVDAIRMAGPQGRRRPRWRAACEGCNRCINLCSRAAIQASPLRTAVHLLVNAAVIVAAVVILNRAAAAAAALGVPSPLRVVAYVAAFIALAVAGSRLQFVALEPALFRLEGLPVLRRLVGKSWTSKFPRYRCPGFRPRGRAG